MLPELFESFDSDTDRAPSGGLKFSELSGRISQELNFWGVPGQRLAPGQGAGGAWPGPRRQPAARGPRQSQGSASAEAGQSVGQSHCRAWQQLAAARGHHGGCIPGVLAAKNLKKMTMRLRTQI
eukprot:gene7527-biopygen6063